MLSLFQIIFWSCVFLIFYVYFGYPLLLLALSKLHPAPPVKEAEIAPFISLIIPAYNEAKVIARKIENALSLAYPRQKLEVIVASDGSTDGTKEIVKGYEDKGVKLVALEINRGKSGAENAAMAIATGDIFVFSDATGMYSHNALKELVSPFADIRVGCVAGLVEYENVDITAASSGEGAYWRYEVFLRLLESRLGNLSMASGSIVACRRSLVESLDEAVGEDFVIPMKAALQGFRTVYAPNSISREMIVETDRGLLKTKVRIITKDLRGLFLCRAILNPFRYPLCAWGLVSHKLLRWLVPYFFISILTINLLLLGRPFYNLTLTLQLAFYSLALVGYIWQRNGKPPRILGIPFSFCLVNLAALIGVARFVMRKKVGHWEPAR